MALVTLACVFRTLRNLTLRCVLAPGEATTVVVAAVVIDAVFVRLGLIVPLALSTQDACTPMAPALPVIT
jgi:hypothetical protein